MTADDLVAAWLLAKFRERNYTHLSKCPEVVVRVAAHGWDCGCYSEYTRDDFWSISAALSCPHGAQAAFATDSSYDLPDILEQLKDLDEASFECPFDD